MPRLPPELVYHIIDHISHPQYDTLHALSLVCRDWSPVARECLFKNIHLCEVRRPGESAPQHDLEGFLDLLSSSPAIALAVRSLSVNRGHRRMSTLPYATLIYVLEMLPNLEELSLENMFLPGIFPDLRGDTPSFTFRSLCLVGIQNPSQSKYAVASFFDFLDLFSSVGETKLKVRLLKDLDEDIYRYVSGNGMLPVKFTTSMLKLEGTELDQGVFISGLMTANLTAVRGLTVTLYELTHIIAPLSALLTDDRCTLDTLTLNLSGYSQSDPNGGTIPIFASPAIQQTLGPALRNLRSLRTLHLSTRDASFAIAAENDLLALLQFLPHTLVDLHLYFGYRVDYNAARRTARTYPALKNIYVHTSSAINADPTAQWETTGNETVIDFVI